MIQEQFNKVIAYSQNISNPQTDNLFERWKAAKAGIIKHFLKGQLIYSHPEKVSFTLDPDTRRYRIEKLIDYIGRMAEIEELVNFLYNIKVEDFFNNRLSEDYIISDDKKIQSGIKVVKAFKYFVTNQKLLDDIQNKASNIIQEDKVEGYLNFSVHPLDYLSISENQFNWRSCHALDGEFRAGNLSYMVDNSTVVCYLSSGTEAILPRFPEEVPWNNKKWRCLLYFNDSYDMIMAGRQYPFFSPGALEAVRSVFVEHMQPARNRRAMMWDPMEWSHWHNDYIKKFTYKDYGSEDNACLYDTEYFVANGHIYNLRDVVKDGEGALQFNDLLRSSFYEDPYYMFIKGRNHCNHIHFTIGGQTTCLQCGENFLNNEQSMSCIDCICKYNDEDLDYDRFPVCDCCGNRFFADHGYYINNEEHICPNCFEREAFVCEECGSPTWNRNKVWVEEENKFMCSNCYEEYQRRNAMGLGVKNVGIDLSNMTWRIWNYVTGEEVLVGGEGILGETENSGSVEDDLPF